MAKVAIHPSVTEQRVTLAVKRGETTLDNPGICLGCGEDAQRCEPDARRYACEACERRLVFGASEILLNGYYHR